MLGLEVVPFQQSSTYRALFPIIGSLLAIALCMTQAKNISDL